MAVRLLEHSSQKLKVGLDIGLVLSKSLKMLVGVVDWTYDGHRGESIRGQSGVNFVNGLSGGP